MAKQVLPIVGGVVGAFFGVPQLGFLAGSLLASAIPEKQTGPGLGDLPVQKSEEGIPRAVGYGTFQCSGYLIDFGKPIETYEAPESAKGSSDNEPNTIYRNYAVAICEGPIAGVLRIWENDKLVYDMRPGSLMIPESLKWVAGDNGFSGKNIFLGTEDQPPSVFLELNVSGVGTTPSYAGTAYMVFGLENLTESRGAIPQYRFEVTKSLTTLQLDPVPSRASWGGIYGGGFWSFGNGLTSNSTLDPDRDVGEVWLAFWLFRATVQPGTVSCYLKVNGQQRWSGFISMEPGQQKELKVQINHEADGAEIEIGFTAGVFGYSGDVFLQLNTLDSDTVYYAYAPESPRVPLIIEPEEDNFGVLVDGSGNYFSAGQISLDVGYLSWGPPSIELLAGSSTTLDAIVQDIHGRCDLSSSDVNVSELTDITVNGYVLQGDYDASAAIDALRSVFFFDRCEPGDKIYYPLRGKPVVDTLTIDDLVEVPDLSKREQASEIPKKLHLSYPNATAGYTPVKADSEIRTGDFASTDEATAQTTVVMDTDTAAQTVAKMHKVMAADAQGEIKFTVPDQWLRLVPSDAIGLSLRGQVRRLRIDGVDASEGKRELTCRVDRQSAYTSAVTGIPVREPTLPPSTIVGDTELAVLDISSRVDTEDDLHYLVAGSGPLPGWHGWALQRSLDGGANYATVQQFQFPSIMGSLVDAVPLASEYFTDTTNAVKVTLYRSTQSLDSITLQQFLSEGGAFALEKPDGSWEVMQYLDAEEDSNGDVILSTLHRGLLNSGASAHDSGAKFVLLQSAEHIPAQSAWIGQELTNRAVSIDESPETGDVETITYAGRSQLEWTVAYLEVQRAGDLVSATWTPRHRFGTEDSPVASINFQGYRVTLDDGSQQVVFDSLTPDFSYDASTLASPVTVSVSSLNRITGPGPAVSQTV